MSLQHHKGLTLARWQQLSFCEQMANVGSEVHRAISWRSKNLEYSQLAFERALELLDLSLAAASAHAPRLKELARVREALADYFVFDNDYGSSDVLWQKWFDAFALAGRGRRARASLDNIQSDKADP
ncbi:MAG: hypothetical protein V1750_02565 [Acidobacteriota bacterium]